MLSLVAYQSSDEGESESEDTSKSVKTFLKLPAPTKFKETVKITVPSLKEFQDDEKDEPSSKKLKPSSGCSLIGMLPPPKYTRPAGSQKPFTPYVLTKKQTPAIGPGAGVSQGRKPTGPKKIPTSAVKFPVRSEPDSHKTTVETEPEDLSPVRDFFSLEEPVSIPNDSDFIPSSTSGVKSQAESSEATETLVTSSMSTFEPSTLSPWENHLDNSGMQYPESASTSGPYSEYNNSQAASSWEDPSSSDAVYSGYPEFHKSDSPRPDNAMFTRLHGKKKGQEEINFIDVSVDDQLTDRTEWLTKSLTEEKAHRPSRKKHDMPTQMQKRKHQITFLAFQAKEREFELKNQWSQNRLTKRETQAKYGF